MENTQEKIILENNEDNLSQNDEELSPQKVRFIKNCIQLVVWLILIFFAYQYLNQHPAEKASMVSWVKIIWQKLQVVIMNIWNRQWNIYDEKYNLERSFSEILTLAKDSPCATSWDLQTITDKSNELKDMNIDQYKLQKIQLNSFTMEYYQKLKTNCTQTSK